ncbi:hypothetical protein [Shewanella halifaxensis]|uniref:hypothetical protein n=1 Tax=Shewanella halifaxensis TaxID=271098 RepID=UPI0009FE7C1B|nr:hypothetical protein [Shewanella halifaxensis]
MKLIRTIWARYIRWCDAMGFTPENRRSCVPHLSDPQLQLANKKAEVEPPSLSSVNPEACCKPIRK